MRFKDKVVVVTGAASGIGAALCRRLETEEARVEGADVAEGSTHRVDVRDAAAVERMLQDVAARHGRLDYVFNNAGINFIGEFRDCTIEQIRAIVEIDLLGVLYGTWAAYRIMLAQGFGHIVNTASGYGLTPGPLNVPYVAAKAGVVGLGDSLRPEAARHGVSITTVCPGFVRTPPMEQPRLVGLTPAMAQAVSAAWSRIRKVEPDAAARIILDGVLQRRRTLMFPAEVGFNFWIFRLLPDLFFRYASKHVEEWQKVRCK